MNPSEAMLFVLFFLQVIVLRIQDSQIKELNEKLDDLGDDLWRHRRDDHVAFDNFDNVERMNSIDNALCLLAAAFGYELFWVGPDQAIHLTPRLKKLKKETR